MDEKSKQIFADALQQLLAEASLSPCLTCEIPGQGSRFWIQLLPSVAEKEPRKCPQCNKRVLPGALFCHMCGTRLPDRPHQPTALTLTFPFPYDRDPLKTLDQQGVALPAGSEVLTWESGQSAVIDIPLHLKTERMAELIDAILTRLLNAPERYTLHCAIGYGY